MPITSLVLLYKKNRSFFTNMPGHSSPGLYASVDCVCLSHLSNFYLIHEVMAQIKMTQMTEAYRVN